MTARAAKKTPSLLHRLGDLIMDVATGRGVLVLVVLILAARFLLGEASYIVAYQSGLAKLDLEEVRIERGL